MPRCYNIKVKKGIILFLLIVFLVFVSTSSVSANVFGFTNAMSKTVRQFGGKIIVPKALEIQELEASGFVCTVYGTTVEIMPIGSPVGTPSSYFIPSYITSKTRTTPRVGQSIMGKYAWKTPIVCIYPSNPPIIKVVWLDTIILFGTSK